MFSRIITRPQIIRQNVISFKPPPIHVSKRTYISPVELVDLMTTSLQEFHQYTNLSWWLLIPLTTITFRTVWTLPLAILQRKRIQKQSQLKPILNATGPILRLKLAQNAQMAQQQLAKTGGLKSDSAAKGINVGAASLTSDQIMMLSVKEVSKRQKLLFKEHGCQSYKNFILPMFQIPLWILMSFTFRNLSGWTDITSKPLDPTLTTEGFGWINDLTIADPSGVMPILLGSLALMNIEWNSKTLELQNQSGSKKRSLRPTAFDALISVSRIGIVFLMAVCTQAPACMGLYWISSNAFSGVQNMVLDYYLPVRYIPENRLSYKKATNDSIPLFEKNLDN
ncbi:Inner membrane protein oxaA [Wickerhamomyces ciferrii]|uniref:Inner membrane protein oxaA n=1 Tax=Wickerhamomyces ciferrii (strain ATCC 14091 / BCRC 22168 / CBS 111 / JCM 3599 / NBRC 0793 / NRRL Y-1031 F-60-10) TaxID=1206466 RepID=K0KHW6_WICCF|nr:Inner membrane protein oxaA [Wickerhamomyces ciferrii]CCH40748.1 Inner membrane protein oxaA [Wickerhamomyces ciferrii]